MYKLARRTILRISCFIDLPVYPVLVLKRRTFRYIGYSVLLHRCHKSYCPCPDAHRAVYKLIRHATLRIRCFIDLTFTSVLLLLGRTSCYPGHSVSLHRHSQRQDKRRNINHHWGIVVAIGLKPTLWTCFPKNVTLRNTMPPENFTLFTPLIPTGNQDHEIRIHITPAFWGSEMFGFCR